MSNSRRECTFQWFIENYSYFRHKYGENLISPEFTANCFDGTVWQLELFPREYKIENKGNFYLSLNRSSSDKGPENFPVKFSLTLIASDGSHFYSQELESTFKKGYGCGWDMQVPIEELLLRRKVDYTSQDTLIVRCKMWIGDGNIQEVKLIDARTRIGIEKVSFFHAVEGFSALEANQKKTISINPPSNKGVTLSSSIYFTDDSWCEGKIIIEITPSVMNNYLSRCKLFLLNASGKLIPCGEADNRSEDTIKNITKLSLSIHRDIILKRKSEFLPEDKLSLLCKCTFATGVEYEKIESTLHETPFEALNQINNDDQKKDACNTTNKLCTYPSALDDFKAIYNKQFLSDVKLKTKTKSFPAHKIVLCARSSVFSAMLVNDMKEKNTSCIDVDDLENDTVQQLLLFLYSDHLENLQWESAMKLYYAADKYDVAKLKAACSSFLIGKISVSSASELLLLADTHNDSDLKKDVEDFIFKNEEQVFGSDEWGNLMETNPLLVSKTMRLKFKRQL